LLIYFGQLFAVQSFSEASQPYIWIRLLANTHCYHFLPCTLYPSVFAFTEIEDCLRQIFFSWELYQFHVYAEGQKWTVVSGKYNNTNDRKIYFALLKPATSRNRRCANGGGHQ